MHHPTDRIAHTTAFVAPVVDHWLERDTGHDIPDSVYGEMLKIIFWLNRLIIRLISSMTHQISTVTSTQIGTKRPVKHSMMLIFVIKSGDQEW